MKHFTVTLFVLISTSVSCFSFENINHHRRSWRLFSQREREPLIPESNPNGTPDAISLGGVQYSTVLSGLERLYPPKDLEKRNALSRTDGYWPFIQKGKDPPQSLIYGEFDFYFFAQLLDRGLTHCGYESWKNKVFTDLGSGTGRLVLAAAALHPNFLKCRGVELLKGVHNAAEATIASCSVVEGEDDRFLLYTEKEALPMAPMELVCGSFEDPYVYFGDSDLIFIFSSCMPRELLDNIAKCIGRQCKPGTLVITTDKMLSLHGDIDPFPQDDRIPYGTFQLSLAEKVEGWCWLTGGYSTAFIHRVEKSLWVQDHRPLEPPELSLEERALEVVKDLESGELTDSKAFIRNVYNNMIFHGIPERFWPKMKDD